MARKACFLVLLLLVSMAVAMADIIDEAKAKFENPEKSMEEAKAKLENPEKSMQEGKEEASTWSSWAKDKMSGLHFFDESKAAQMAGDTTEKAKERLHSASIPAPAPSNDPEQLHDDELAPTDE